MLTAGGGYLGANGLIEPGQTEEIAGAVMLIVGVVWSIIEKKKAKPAAQP